MKYSQSSLHLDSVFAHSPTPLRFINAGAMFRTFMVIHRHVQSRPMHTFPAEVEQGDALLFCFRSHAIYKYPFCSLFSAMVFTLGRFLLIILLFEMVPRHSVEVSSDVPKHEKAAMCLTEKIHILDELLLGMSYSAVNMSSILMNQQYVLNQVELNRHTHATLCIDQLMKMKPEAPGSLTLFFLLAAMAQYLLSVFGDIMKDYYCEK